MEYELRHKTKRRISAGNYYPLGANLDEGGGNFAIYSQHASEIFLLLFDRPDGGPTDIIQLEQPTKHIWHTFVHGLKAGQLYGYKIRGDFNPGYAMRFNENKLLIDPYAKALAGKANNKDNLLLSYDPNSLAKDLSMDKRDNTPIVPKSIVIDDHFDWQGDELTYASETLLDYVDKGYIASDVSSVKADDAGVSWINGTAISPLGT
mgnify:CR=1 FL=1